MFSAQDVSEFRLVNGDLIELSVSERQAIADEWNASMPSHLELVAATLRKAAAMRMEIFRVLDHLHLSAITNNTQIMVNNEPVALATVIEFNKQALRDITETVDLSQCTTQQQMEGVVLLAYKAIVDAAPPEIKSAFDSLKP